MTRAPSVIARAHPKFELVLILAADLVMAVATVAIAGMIVVLAMTPG